jgi:FkbM family methyltransferase
MTVAPHLRRWARRLARRALVLLRRGPLRRRLSRLAYPRWAAACFRGREVVGWRGVRVAVDPGEAHGFHVYFLGDYARAEIDACIELAGGGGWFADVGANIGLVSLAVARAIPGLRVLAVEADPAVCDWLRENVALNPDLAPRIHIVQAAATDRDGPVRFARAGTAANVGVGRIAGEGDGGGADVGGVAVGPLAARDGHGLDVVKIDVEGGELAVLCGLWTPGPPPRGLVIETHAFQDPQPEVFNRALVDELTRRGYVVDALRRGRWSRLDDARALGPRGHLRAYREAGIDPSSAFSRASAAAATPASASTAAAMPSRDSAPK